MTNKYINMIEKRAIVGTAIGIHLAQNQITKGLLSSAVARKHIANGFASGFAGVNPHGIKSTLARVTFGAVAPELSVMRQKAYQAGKDWLYENGVNSVSGSIKRTSAALKSAQYK